MNLAEFRAHTQRLLTMELKQRFCWWWLSFHGPKGEFRGVCIVEARGLLSATMTTHIIGVNPGGTVQGFALNEKPADEFCNKLLSKPEAMRVQRTLK